MGKLEFQINLDNSDAVYHPGETIAGKLVVGVKEETKIRSNNLLTLYVLMDASFWFNSMDWIYIVYMYVY